jgi:hypothetical protein
MVRLEAERSDNLEAPTARGGVVIRVAQLRSGKSRGGFARPRAARVRLARSIGIPPHLSLPPFR